MKFGFEIAAALVAFGMTIPAAQAHEFWVDGTILEQDGETLLSLDLNVGQMLDGISLPYIPETVQSFEWIDGGTGNITGIIGATPAARVPFDPDQGAVIFHRTAPRRLIHSDWAKFLDYLEMEGLGQIAAAHGERGLPQTGFTESYTRHAKFILADPDGQTLSDRYLGSPLEIVLDAVQTDGEDVVIRGSVVGDGDPEPHQISVFYPSPTGAKVLRLRSARDGGFSVTIPERGPVLLNAVAMSPGAAEDTAWHSDWASVFLKLK